MNKLFPVIGFSFSNKVKTKSFIVTTIVLSLVLSVVIHLPYLIQLFSGGSNHVVTKIGIVAGGHDEIVQSLEDYVSNQPAKSLELVKYEREDLATLEEAMEKQIGGYLKFENGEERAFPVVTFVSNDGSVDDRLQAILQPALEFAKMQHVTKGTKLTDEQIAAITAPVVIVEQSLSNLIDSDGAKDNRRGEQESLMNFFIVLALIILLFATNTMTGNMIAAEVTAEKSSRIMEILITSVSPLVQMFGKILAMFFVGLLQIGILIAVIAGNLALPHNHSALASVGIDLTDLNIDILIIGIVFYILGYFLYATLFAAVGSIVSRTEDLGQAIMPITLLSLASFYIASFSLGAPNSLLLKICSYIPFVSPTTIMIRYGLGDAGAIEIVLSIVILLLAILFFGWLAAKIYRTGVLLYGKRPSLKELRKAMKAYKL